MKIPISIIKSILNTGLPQDIEKRIQMAGFFCSKEDEYLAFEPASIRPDTNSVVGILKECAIVSGFLPENKGEKDFCEEKDDYALPKEVEKLCLLKLNDLVLLDENWKNCLRHNGIRETDSKSDFANILTIYTGIPFVCVPECSADEIELEVEDNKIDVRIRDFTFTWGKYPGYTESLCFLALVVPPEFMKKYYKGIDIRSNSFINYYIRKQNVSFCKEIDSVVDKNLLDLKIFSNKVEEENTICCSKKDCEEILGKSISDEEYEHYLKLLGYRNDGQSLTVPIYRSDVTSVEDIAADIARIKNLDRKEHAPVKVVKSDSVFYYIVREIRNRLLGMGYDETMLFPFIDRDVNSNEQVILKYLYSNKTIALREDSLTELVAYVKKEKPSLGCYEVARVFKKQSGSYKEKYVLSIVDTNKANNLFGIMNFMLNTVKPDEIQTETSDERIEWRFFEGNEEIAHFVSEISGCGCDLFAVEADLNHIVSNYDRRNVLAQNGCEKHYSIDLPIHYSVLNLLKHIKEFQSDDISIVNITIDEWKYNKLEKGKLWTCAMTVLFDTLDKDELKRFNKWLYEIAI